jgi:hypothetical protein
MLGRAHDAAPRTVTATGKDLMPRPARSHIHPLRLVTPEQVGIEPDAAVKMAARLLGILLTIL